MYAYREVHAGPGSQRMISGVGCHLPPCLSISFSGVYHCEFLAGTQISRAFPASISNAWYQTLLYLGSGDSNSCPDTCMASTLPISQDGQEPSPKPSIWGFLSAHFVPGVWGAIQLYHSSLGSWDLLKGNLPTQLLFWTPAGYLTKSQMKGVKNLCS